MDEGTEVMDSDSMDMSHFSRVYCVDDTDVDESLIPTEEEIEAEMARLFPFIPPPEFLPATPREEVEYLISQLGIGSHAMAMQRIRRLEETLSECSQGVQKASKMMDPMLDEMDRNIKLYNKCCQSQMKSSQNVVLRTVEIDADGVLRTVNNPKEAGEDEIIDLEDKPATMSQEDRPRVKCGPVPEDSNAVMDMDDDVAAIGEVKPGQTIFGENTKYTVAPTPRILPRMVPAVNKKVYAMKGSALNNWVPAIVLKLDRNAKTGNQEFHVQLEPNNATGRGKGGRDIRIMDARHLAFCLKTPFLLPVGARIIARFKDDLKVKKGVDNDFYAGIVAERPIPHNQNRYLIFFDDGYAQYVSIDNVLWVCESSKDVWNDVHPSSQAFIKEYLKIYPERPMVRLSKGTIVSTEWNGNWWIGRVVDVDCSLVKIYFEADNRYEWIYRGSSRLAPLYNKQKRQEARSAGIENKAPNQSPGPGRARRRMHDVHAASHSNEAKIEYVNYTAPPTSKFAQTARKSTAAPPPPTISPPTISPPLPPWTQPGNQSHVNPVANYGKKPPGITTSTGLLEYEGRMNKLVIPKSVEGPSVYLPHNCRPACVRPYNESDPDTNQINPLSLPMYYGFTREIGKNPRRTIFYRAPCGRRLRDYDELHEFLTLTRYNMGIDHFCFDFAVDCFNEFVPASNHFIIGDITYGKEVVPVQCCNSVDHEYPEYVEYSKSRQPANDVHMNLDADFLSCCDCTDDCANKEKCACWQMTMEGLNKSNHVDFNLEVGYQNRRLMDHCVTGIYECNRRCACKKTCLNRVVQFDMKWQLQIFKTSNKGWAIRPIHDIPQGAFICIYAGQLLTEHGANEDGKAFGDEYLAELDYIEVCESYKAGYESDAIEPDSGSRRERRHSGADVGELVDEEDKDYIADGPGDSYRNGDAKTYSLRANKRFDDEENEEREDRNETKSVRELFGKDEYCYIMDAKSSGNIGRYLNHSCQPNVFVQNVFVDTHDLRFPWVAFFAYKHIRAGTELTWDYNYDIGSVPGKTMYCYCGTPECRGRLL